MKIKNLLASGCSFTHDGIGGVPPTNDSAGGSSFKQYDDIQPASCASWASFLSTFLEVESFINFAAPSHGNVLICETIISALEKYNYKQDDTLIIFNISSMDRFDLKIDWENSENNTNIYWTSELLDYTFAKTRGPLWKKKFASMELEEITSLNISALEKLLKYLKDKNYMFLFTVMQDYSDNLIIQQYKDNLVTLNPGIGMHEFCKEKNLLIDDNFHPSTQGHKQIAEQVLDFITKKILPIDIIY
ncbi:MAG: hypothetical protein CMF52_00820 [Legionellales bacterium]|nr:hypothetical protein [Legionellales bacterium]